VHVHEGGQAIVGTVQAGDGERSKSKELPNAEAITDAPGEPLPGDHETLREAVPVAGR
jgi:hypothetical protein